MTDAKRDALIRAKIVLQTVARDRQKFGPISTGALQACNQINDALEAADPIPDLLAALEDIASSPCSMVNDSESIRASFNRLGRVARAAIAKATGQVK